MSALSISSPATGHSPSGRRPGAATARRRLESLPGSSATDDNAARSAHGGRRVRLTRRGRVVFFLVFLVLIAGAMVGLGGFATATFDSGTPEPVRIVEVGPGDTLYGIAGEVAEPGKVREMVAHIEQLNALDGPQLQIGQRLAVPRG